VVQLQVQKHRGGRRGRSVVSAAATRRGIVTGAASGIGRAVARRMLREGVDVLAVDVAADKLLPLEGPHCTTLVADLSDPAARERLADMADGADYLVNSHGIIMIRPIFEITLEDWRRVQTINAESIFFLCQKIGPRLKPGGAIVNLSSSSAKLATTIEVAAYAASKTTILSITRSFANALADRPVRVNAILPGIVDTPMQETVLDTVSVMRGTTKQALGDARNKNVPLGRPSSPDECANLIWFLLSDESSYMTGQAINFTGGHITW
jgi:NAD(P)-dependent dehydrogenase (short-subunit alcohol dehydrogenase family)